MRRKTATEFAHWSLHAWAKMVSDKARMGAEDNDAACFAKQI
jgi:hypothetical protein